MSLAQLRVVLQRLPSMPPRIRTNLADLAQRATATGLVGLSVSVLSPDSGTRSFLCFALRDSR